MCRRQTGIGTSETLHANFKPRLTTIPAIGRLCEKCDGKWCVYSRVFCMSSPTLTAFRVETPSPVCDSYVRPETLVRICDECNFGTYGGRCIICGSPGLFPPAFLRST